MLKKAALSSESWRRELKEAYRSVRELGGALGLPQSAIDDAEQAVPCNFPMLVTRAFAQRMVHGDLNDPLLRQVWPTGQTDNIQGSDSASFVTDPVGDCEAIVANGLLHKYTGRVLLVTTGACAIHCRYCFRQNFDYSAAPKSLTHWEPAFEYLRSRKDIGEVILSGGDPLMLVDDTLNALMDQIEAIGHVDRLRIHTRMPIVLPSRVTHALRERLEKTRLAVYIVVHCNHVQEIDQDVRVAIEALRDARCVLLNQAVLLRGINDNVEAQYALCESLINIGVIPYYLHQLDRVRGAEAYEADNELGLSIIESLRRRLPGFAIPTFVQEIAGQASKTPLVPITQVVTL